MQLRHIAAACRYLPRKGARWDCSAGSSSSNSERLSRVSINEVWIIFAPLSRRLILIPLGDFLPQVSSGKSPVFLEK